MKIFLSGGSKSGKSMLAQRFLRDFPECGRRCYIATMQPHDEEDRRRIARHLTERDGWGFETVECPRDIEKCTELIAPDSAILLDSFTALLANEMFLPDGSCNERAADKIVPGLIKLLRHVKHAVCVSDFLYCDAALYDEYTERYRRALAQIDRAAALECDAAAEVVCGQAVWYKGGALV